VSLVKDQYLRNEERPTRSGFEELAVLRKGVEERLVLFAPSGYKKLGAKRQFES
jgi:hypothetical protein